MSKTPKRPKNSGSTRTKAQVAADAAAFNKAREAALLSLDLQTILTFAEQYHVPGLTVAYRRHGEHALWYVVHLMRCSIRALPLPARRESLDWLRLNNLPAFGAEDIDGSPEPKKRSPRRDRAS